MADPVWNDCSLFTNFVPLAEEHGERVQKWALLEEEEILAHKILVFLKSSDWK